MSFQHFPTFNALTFLARVVLHVTQDLKLILTFSHILTFLSHVILHVEQDLKHILTFFRIQCT